MSRSWLRGNYTNVSLFSALNDQWSYPQCISFHDCMIYKHSTNYHPIPVMFALTTTVTSDLYIYIYICIYIYIYIYVCVCVNIASNSPLCYINTYIALAHFMGINLFILINEANSLTKLHDGVLVIRTNPRTRWYILSTAYDILSMLWTPQMDYSSSYFTKAQWGICV